MKYDASDKYEAYNTGHKEKYKFCMKRGKQKKHVFYIENSSKYKKSSKRPEWK
jgi:hypothetical protein